MPLQRRAAQGFAGAAVEIDLIHKGIMTRQHPEDMTATHLCGNRPDS